MKKILILGLVLLLSMAGEPAAELVKRAARITDMAGTVEVKIGKNKWAAANVGMVLNEGDFIRTRANSSALLKLEGEVETAEVEVQPNSQLLISELKEDKAVASQNTLLDLALGKVLIRAQKLHSENSKFEVKTPTSIVGVRGTTFAVEVEQAE